MTATSILDDYNHLIMADPNSGCWIWTGCLQWKGHGQLRKRGVTKSSHRMSWEITNGPIPTGLYVLHKCNNAPCVNPAHLYLGTHQDNMRDMRIAGTRKGKTHGERSGRALLKESDIPIIRARRAAGEVSRIVAQDYGVSLACIEEIYKRRNWKHVA